MKPDLLTIGPLTVHSWGLMVALAIFAGILVVRRRAQDAGLEKDEVFDLALLLAFAGLVGGRLVYVLLEPSVFLSNPMSLLSLWMGGLSIHGALLGGVVAGLAYARVKRLSFGRLADIVAPGLLLGQAIGRIGCFLNGDSYGRLTSVPWAVTFPNLAGPRHPTQLYEAGLALAGFLLLVWLRERVRERPGQLFLAYLVTYSAIRFLVEVFRESEYLLPSLTYAQVASVAIAGVALVLILLPRLRHKPA